MNIETRTCCPSVKEACVVLFYQKTVEESHPDEIPDEESHPLLTQSTVLGFIVTFFEYRKISLILLDK